MKNLGIINKLIYLLNIVVAVILLFSYVLPFFPPKAFAALSVLNLGAPILIVINLLFFIYWLIKLKRQFILSALVLTVGYIFFGSIYQLSSSKYEETANQIKVMNYNVRLFNLYHWIPDTDIDTKIVDFVKEQAPDILCIQEYHPSKSVDLSFFNYKYEQVLGNKTKHGQAIFSKFPIINSGSVEFPDTPNNAIFVDVVKEKDTLRIYNVHLESLRITKDIEDFKNEDSERLFNRVGGTFKRQQEQAELFLAHKKSCAYKMIVCSDLNNTAFSYVYRKIKNNLNDAFREAGRGYGSTYDFKFIPLRIDFIFTDKFFTINSFKTYGEKYSDHHPIMATLAIN